MAERFDPYYKWLGIPPRDQPPSHYRLLGLEVFESDPEVIDRAANRLMDYLHGITDGEHLAHAQALLNEIAAARLCLLSDEQKRLYDKRLRAEEASKRRTERPDEPPARRSGATCLRWPCRRCLRQSSGLATGTNTRSGRRSCPRRS